MLFFARLFGGGEVNERRYLGGLKPQKYFQEVLWPDLEDTFQILGFSKDRGFEV